jgi:hypothetical protein
MAGFGRCGVLAGLVLVAAASAGCDLKTMAYFLLPDAKDEAEIHKIASDDPIKEVKVVILTYSALEVRPEFIKADLQLSELLAKQLRDLCEADDERVSIVQPRKVEAFKNSHPNWHTLDPAEIGTQFHADYVIYIEINSMTLYDKGNNNALFHGQANLSVTLVDVNNANNAYPERKEFTCGYPADARGPIPAEGDMSAMEFRHAFLNYVAKRLSWYFAPHPRRESYYVE